MGLHFFRTYIQFVIGMMPFLFLLFVLLGGGLGMVLALSDNYDKGHIKSSTLTSWPGSSGFPTAPAGSLQSAEDKLAAKSMPVISWHGRYGQPPIKKVFPTMTMPLHWETGMGWSDFPHSDTGAVQALAAIDQAALDNGQTKTARAVYDELALPGAVAFKDWAPMGAIDDAITPGTYSPKRWKMRWTPTHGMIKGSLDGGNYVVACVLGELQVHDKDDADLSFGDCQRMVWTAQGWRIGAGAQPFPAPQTFPDGLLCLQVGWKKLNYA